MESLQLASKVGQATVQGILVWSPPATFESSMGWRLVMVSLRRLSLWVTFFIAGHYFTRSATPITRIASGSLSR